MEKERETHTQRWGTPVSRVVVSGFFRTRIKRQSFPSVLSPQSSFTIHNMQQKYIYQKGLKIREKEYIDDDMYYIGIFWLLK